MRDASNPSPRKRRVKVCSRGRGRNRCHPSVGRNDIVQKPRPVCLRHRRNRTIGKGFKKEAQHEDTENNLRKTVVPSPPPLQQPLALSHNGSDCCKSGVRPRTRTAPTARRLPPAGQDNREVRTRPIRSCARNQRKGKKLLKSLSLKRKNTITRKTRKRTKLKNNTKTSLKRPAQKRRAENSPNQWKRRKRKQKSSSSFLQQ